MGVLCLILLRIHLEYEFEEVALKAALSALVLEVQNSFP